MTNEKRGPAGPAARRRRPATIDLKATEIASEPVKPAEPVEPTRENPEAAPEVHAAAPAPEVQAAPPAEPPPEVHVAPPSEPPPADTQPQQQWSERLSGLRANLGRMNWHLMGAAAVGSAAMLALLLAIFATGAFNARDEQTAARLADVEQQARDLAARPQGADQRALAELATRVGAAEQATGRLAGIESRLARAEQGAGRLGELDSRLARAEQGMTRLGELEPRIAKVESTAASAAASAATPRPAPGDPALAGRVAALETAQKNAVSAPALPSGEIEALTARVAALEQGAKGAEDRIARAAASAGTDRAGRLAFVAVSLRAAVERGEPFAQELAAVRPLTADAKALSALEPFATTGVPRAATLARELSGLTGSMLGAAGSAPRDGGFIDRLQANAERLVRIRPISEAPGDDAATVIARADVKASHGDLAGALAEVASLPPAVRAPAQGWTAKVEARAAALAAARNLAENAVGALAKP